MECTRRWICLSLTTCTIKSWVQKNNQLEKRIGEIAAKIVAQAEKMRKIKRLKGKFTLINTIMEGKMGKNPKIMNIN